MAGLFGHEQTGTLRHVLHLTIKSGFEVDVTKLLNATESLRELYAAKTATGPGMRLLRA